MSRPENPGKPERIIQRPERPPGLENANPQARKAYEDDLAAKRVAHLSKVQRPTDEWKPCLHDLCETCFGTRLREDGTACIHSFVCDCPKCTRRTRAALQLAEAALRKQEKR